MNDHSRSTDNRVISHQNSSSQDEFSHLLIPKLLHVSHQEWTVIGDQKLLQFLHDEQVIYAIYYQIIDNLIHTSGGVNRRCIADFNSIILTAAIFHQSHTIHLYSHHMNYELLLIQELARLKHSVCQSKILQNYVDHVEKAVEMNLRDFPSVIEEVCHTYDLTEIIECDQDEKIQKAMHAHTEQLLQYINQYRSGLFEKVSDFALNLTAQYALIRVHLLKFIAMLPSLDHDKKGKEVKRMLLETLRRLTNDSTHARFLGKKGDQQALPLWLERSFKLTLSTAKLIPAYLLTAFIRFSVKQMAKRFIAGESIDHVANTFGDLKRTQRDATLDQLGELVVSEKEADHYKNEVLNLINGLGQHYPKGEQNQASINRSHVSIKVSALCSDFRAEAYDYSKSLVAPRLKAILLAAKKNQVFLNIDAEHYDYRDLVFKIYRDVLLETPELSEYQQTGIVLQAYVRDAHTHLQDILTLAKKRGILMPIRLVKGAYWDAETVHADAHSYNAPEFLNKEETDLSFRTLVHQILHHGAHLQLCLASHNYSDHVFCEVLRDHTFPQAPIIEHQCLHMTYEALSTALAKMGWATRNYMPVGSLLVGMAYLVRRIMENSSQVGVLTIMRSHKNNITVQSPWSIHQQKKAQGLVRRDRSQSMITHQFIPVSPVRLYLESHLDAMLKQLQEVKQAEPLHIENAFEVHGEWREVYSNSDTSIMVAKLQEAAIEDVDSAVQMSLRYFRESSWTSTAYIERSMILLRVAEEMLQRRLELSAWIIKEAGKTVSEALADVDEAIDFLQFYARQEGRFQYRYPQAKARGVLAVVAPWNFPLAIPCGMVSAALVAGNTVILKSAEQTPMIASLMVDMFHNNGLNPAALIHLPGEGETIGDTLIQHEQIHGVVFTGSKKVGLYLAHTLGRKIVTYPHSKTHVHNQEDNPQHTQSDMYQNQLCYPAQVITEMGGKNAIIVTANAELDETVAGILYSAFAHAGQKCSAASRIIVHHSILKPLKTRLKQAILDLQVDQAWNLNTYINPIVSREDQHRLKEQIKQAGVEALQKGGEILVDRSQENLPGTCVGPAAFILPSQAFVDPNSFACKELFGPVIHLTSFHQLSEAIELFNSTEYALTGGVFSQSQDDIDVLLNAMECGNLYVNRSITGARVGIEPFGGFKLSGTGPKAGCAQYLEAFHVHPVASPVLTNLVRLGSEDPLSEADQVILATPSQLSVQRQVPRVARGVEQLIKNFEFLYQGIYGENKQVLIRFKAFLQKDMIPLIQNPQNNVVIPGQISANSYQLTIPHLVVIAYEPRAYLASLLSVVSALARNVGVCVACRNDESFFWWSHVSALFYQVGIEPHQFKVQQSSVQALTHAIENRLATTLLVDGKIEQLQALAEIAYQFKYTERTMIKLLSPFDSPALSHCIGFIEQFTQIRSLAINTMRHGAPLEIET